MARILLVDDDPGVRANLARLLEHDGHEIVTAADGAEALGILENEAIDLVISDLVMPNMDGLELLRRLRRMPAPPPAIAISGGGRGFVTDYLDIATLFGARAALHKPIVLSELRQHIETLTKR
jgi:CheY-like chemotaxis protein